MAEFGPYATPQALLRDQLWRCWLAVEYQIRQRWAFGALPRSDDGGEASWAPENVAGVFRWRSRSCPRSIPSCSSRIAT